MWDIVELGVGLMHNLGGMDGYNPHMLPKLRSEAIMAAAKFAPCTLKLCSYFPGYRCSGPETTVGAHLPVAGKGMSTKVTDLAVAFACGRCHDILDGRDLERYNHLTDRYPSVLPTRCLHAVVETWTMLAMEDVLTIANGEWI